MKIKILIILIAMIVFGGLDNYRELQDLAIVSAISIDKNEDGTYLMSAQIVNSKKESSGTKSGATSSDVTVYYQNASTIQEGLRNIIEQSPKKLYIAHMNMVVISEDVAKNDIHECVDFFMRDNETSINGLMLVVKEGSTAQDVLKILTPIENNSTKNLSESIDANLKYVGTTVKSTFLTSMTEILNENLELLMASCEIEGQLEEAEKKENLENSETEARLLLSDIAYFNKDEFKGYLSAEDSKTLNLLKNDIGKTVYSSTINDKKISFELLSSMSKIDPKYENGSFSLDIKLETKILITEKDPMLELDTNEDISTVENEINEIIKKYIESFFYNMFNVYETDVLGVRDMFYKNYYNEYIAIKDIFYEEYFKNIKFNINVISSLEEEGGVLKKW